MTSDAREIPRAGGAAPAWLALALVLVACAIPMTFGLGARDSTHTMEYVAIATSQETWLRWHEDAPDPWYFAFDDDMPRVRKPPFVVWINALAWTGLDPQIATPETLILRARTLALLMGLVTIAGVFWAARTLFDLRAAVLAALVVGSTLFLQRQARTASYDIHVTAWITMSIASALWAMRPFGPCPGRARRLVGWTASAAAATLAVYTKNPMAAACVGLPLAGAIALLPKGRRGEWLGLGVVIVISLAAVGAWYIALFRVYPEAVDQVMKEFRLERATGAQPVYYYAGVVGLVAPWSIWLIAGLLHPFVGAERARRRRHLVAWLWFVSLLVLFSIPGAKQQRYILPALPAVGLIVAAVWCDHQAMADRGRRDTGIRPFVWIHWGALLVVSVAIAVVVSDPVRADAWLQAITGRFAGGLLARTLTGIETVPAITAGLALVTIAGLGLRWHLQWRPYRAALACAAWGLVLLGVIWHAYGDAPAGVNPLRAPAEALRARIGDAPIRFLRFTSERTRKRRLDEVFRIYVGRTMHHLRPDAIDEYVETTTGPVYILTIDDPEDRSVMRSASFEDVGAVRTDADEHMRLWRFERNE